MLKHILLILIYCNLENFTAIAEPDNRLPPPITGNNSKPKAKEYIYRIPSSPQKRVIKKKYTFYRVEVPGDCRRLLVRVKKIEPRAFVQKKEGFIQVGLFQKPSQAQQSVKKLANVGLLAKIIKVYR